MEDYVIDDEGLAPTRKSRLPGTGFFVPDDVRRTAEDQEVRERADGADVLVVTDPDPDGLASAAVVRAACGSGALIPVGPHNLGDGLRRAAEYGAEGAQVFVCDLCPDDFEDVAGELKDLVAGAASVRWFDHHQWEADVAAAVRDAGVDLVIGESDEECTADVAVRSVDADLPPHLTELAVVTRDHDLWINDDPRSADLADYSYWTDPEEYLAVIQEHGADLPEEATAFLEERRVEKDDFIERAVKRADFHEIEGVTVAATYGRCSQNEVAETLRQQGADAAVVVKPAGSASIRGSEGFERCHFVARRVNGGGHPRAAGCKPDIYDDMLDYAHHWTTEGAVTKRVILDAFRDLPDAEDAE